MWYLFACAAGSGSGSITACTGVTDPVLTVSESELSFGPLEPGERAEAVVEVRNTGDAPLGVSDIGFGEGLPELDLTVGTASCVAMGLGDEPVYEEHDTGGLEPWDPDSAEPPPATDLPVWVLPPGCSLPVTVGYTAGSYARALDALVVRSRPLDPSGEPTFRYDRRHAWRVVWIAGASTASDTGRPDTGGSEDTGDPPPGDGRIVGQVIAADATGIWENETTGLEVRTWGDATYNWFSSEFDDPPLDRQDSREVRFTGPPFEGCVRNAGEYVSVYAVALAENGQDWAWAPIAVWDDTTALECPTLPQACPGPDTCETGSGRLTPLVLLLIVARIGGVRH